MLHTEFAGHTNKTRSPIGLCAPSPPITETECARARARIENRLIYVYYYYYYYTHSRVYTRVCVHFLNRSWPTGAVQHLSHTNLPYSHMRVHRAPPPTNVYHKYLQCILYLSPGVARPADRARRERRPTAAAATIRAFLLYDDK